MSRLEEIDVTLYPDGRVEVKVRGAEGEACLLATRDLEQHLGGVVLSREATDEMLSDGPEVEDRQTVGDR